MKLTALVFLWGILLTQTATAIQAAEYIGSEGWQQRRLFTPSPNELQQEAAGRIFIYDGMMEADLDHALDDQFQRLESMMFIRTKRQLPEGEIVAYDDDDC